MSNLTEATAKAAEKQLPSDSGSDLDEESSAQGSTASVHPREVASTKPAPIQKPSAGGFPPPSETAAILRQSKVGNLL